MTRYLLDTDTVSFALRGMGRVVERLRERRPSEIAVSAVTVQGPTIYSTGRVSTAVPAGSAPPSATSSA